MMFSFYEAKGSSFKDTIGDRVLEGRGGAKSTWSKKQTRCSPQGIRVTYKILLVWQIPSPES